MKPLPLLCFLAVLTLFGCEKQSERNVLFRHDFSSMDGIDTFSTHSDAEPRIVAGRLVVAAGATPSSNSHSRAELMLVPIDATARDEAATVCLQVGVERLVGYDPQLSNHQQQAIEWQYGTYVTDIGYHPGINISGATVRICTNVASGTTRVFLDDGDAQQEITHLVRMWERSVPDYRVRFSASQQTPAAGVDQDVAAFDYMELYTYTP